MRRQHSQVNFCNPRVRCTKSNSRLTRVVEINSFKNVGIGAETLSGSNRSIASYEEMKARTMAVARGERRISPGEPKVWFTSTESFAKVLSAGNRELLRVIAEKAPGSLDELARITGKAKSNLSRTLRTMEGYGLVRLERGERGRITPKVMHDRVELDLPLTLSRKAT